MVLFFLEPTVLPVESGTQLLVDGGGSGGGGGGLSPPTHSLSRKSTHDHEVALSSSLDRALDNLFSNQ